MPRHFSSLNSFRAAVCLTLLLFLSAVAHAEKTDQLKPQGYVSDFAGVLSASAKAQLTALCGEVQQKTGAQIAVVTVKSLDGQAVEDRTGMTIDLSDGRALSQENTPFRTMGTLAAYVSQLLEEKRNAGA